METPQSLFKIPVHPAGIVEDCPPFIYFPDEETKQSYVDAEYTFCLDELIRFQNAESSDDRLVARRKLNLKRAVFAIKMGYGPHILIEKVWIFQPECAKL